MRMESIDMSGPSMRSRQLVLSTVVCVAMFIAGNVTSAQDEQLGPLQEIAAAFPNSIEMRPEANRLTVEFCPDNTCESFVAERAVSTEDLNEFGYLYIYFVSKYYVLQDWRIQQGPASVARQILSKTKYGGCKHTTSIARARCALSHLGRRGRIRVYAVRYDEGVRIARKMDLKASLKIKQ